MRRSASDLGLLDHLGERAQDRLLAWALLCDIEMTYLMATSRLHAELARVASDPSGAVSPGRRRARRAGQAAMIACVCAYLILEMVGCTRLVRPF